MTPRARHDSRTDPPAVILHRTSSPARRRVSGTDIHLIRVSAGDYAFFAGTIQAQDWLADNELRIKDITFRTAKEARQALTAALTLDPAPTAVGRTATLIRVRAGRYRTTDNTWEITRRPDSGWEVRRAADAAKMDSGLFCGEGPAGREGCAARTLSPSATQASPQRNRKALQ